MDAGLKRALEEKVRAGERLTREDGVALYDSDDLAWLGGLAHEVRTRQSGDAVSFTRNRHLTLTDVCTEPCAFCSSPRQPGQQDVHARTVEEAVRFVTATADGPADGVTELHLTAGLHRTLPWSFYPGLLKALKDALPQVSLKAFTATEIHHFEKVSGRPAADVLDELIDAGLASLTCGGAELLDPEVRRSTVGHDTSWQDWARIHRLAHGRGLRTPCSTLHVPTEEPGHRVDQVLRLRELQDATGGFQVLVPLLPRSLQDLGGALGQDGTGGDRPQARSRTATGAEALKTFAVSRLLFDNVPHISASWATYGTGTAQLALQHGADDLDGSGTPDELTREDFLDLIRDAGLRPVARDSRYEVIRAYEGADPGRRDVPQPMRV